MGYHPYQSVPMTARPAWALAARHGLGSVAAFADSLPEHAQVLDVGAGHSNFGRHVAMRRPDVRWTSLDVNYTPEHCHDMAQNQPPNLTFMRGDATRLTEVIEPRSVDCALSYWLFPHLSAAGLGAARLAAVAMFEVTKPGGVVSIGPTFRRGIRSMWPWAPLTVRAQKSACDAAALAFAERVTQATALSLH